VIPHHQSAGCCREAMTSFGPMFLRNASVVNLMISGLNLMRRQRRPMGPSPKMWIWMTMKKDLWKLLQS